MPIVQRVRPHKGYGNRYLAYAANVASSCGEDGVIQAIFTKLPAAERDNWCLEFGAWDGKLGSNTWNLIANHGWRGVLIEADRDRFKELQQNYAGNNNVACFNRLIELSGANSIDSILAATKIPKSFDYASIDIDGMDYYVWESMTKYKPKVVTIEFNLCIPNNVLFVQDKDPNICQGASLLAMVELGKHKGYELAAVTNTNATFVSNHYFGALGIQNNHIDAMCDDFDHTMSVFQLYDGTLHVEGRKTLLWHGVDFEPEDMQVLPLSMRKNPWQRRRFPHGKNAG